MTGFLKLNWKLEDYSSNRAVNFYNRFRVKSYSVQLSWLWGVFNSLKNPNPKWGFHGNVVLAYWVFWFF